MDNMFKIIDYDDKYRDDMIFMILQAKDSLGIVPTINEDLLNINDVYMNSGNKFWLAIDNNNRVIGSIGYLRIANTNEAFIHRFYIKVGYKRKGIGTKLLKTLEIEMKKSGIEYARVHLGFPQKNWFESYIFYPKHGYKKDKDRYLIKKI